jgi:hypothetical protein
MIPEPLKYAALDGEYMAETLIKKDGEIVTVVKGCVVLRLSNFSYADSHWNAKVLN